MAHRPYTAQTSRDMVSRLFGTRTCWLCGTQNVDVDHHHALPCYADGESEWQNLYPLCTNHSGKSSCHAMIHAIYTRAEETAGRYLTFAEYLDIMIDQRNMLAVLKAASATNLKESDDEIISAIVNPGSGNPSTGTLRARLLDWATAIAH